MQRDADHYGSSFVTTHDSPNRGIGREAAFHVTQAQAHGVRFRAGVVAVPGSNRYCIFYEKLGASHGSHGRLVPGREIEHHIGFDSELLAGKTNAPSSTQRLKPSTGVAQIVARH